MPGVCSSARRRALELRCEWARPTWPRSSVAQWQSTRLLIGWLLVRVQSEELVLTCGFTTGEAARIASVGSHVVRTQTVDRCCPRSAHPRRRPRGAVGPLPSGALRVSVYAGIDPVLNAGTTCARSYPRARRPGRPLSGTRRRFLRGRGGQRDPGTHRPGDRIQPRERRGVERARRGPHRPEALVHPQTHPVEHLLAGRRRPIRCRRLRGPSPAHPMP